MASRYRHEDVSAIPSGWKVRTLMHGNHRVKVAFPRGRRKIGAGRLVSILHPINENPCGLRSSNPAELLVMGANPPRKRKNNPAELMVIGANPPAALRNPYEKVKDSKGRTWWTGVTASGHDFMAEAFPVTGKRIKKAGRPVYARGASHGEAYDRLLEKIEPNPARRTRGPAHNPAAETIFEEFSGTPCRYVTTETEPHMPAGDYAQLGDPGELLSLFVKPLIGGPVQEIAFKQDRPVIVTDRTARQLYFVKGDQDISDSLHLFVNPVHAGGVLLLGEGRRIDYKARKEHVAKPEQAEWKHEFGEENGAKPRVLFDTQHKRLLLEGGDYRIDGAWIRN